MLLTPGAIQATLGRGSYVLKVLLPVTLDFGLDRGRPGRAVLAGGGTWLVGVHVVAGEDRQRGAVFEGLGISRAVDEHSRHGSELNGLDLVLVPDGSLGLVRAAMSCGHELIGDKDHLAFSDGMAGPNGRVAVLIFLGEGVDGTGLPTDFMAEIDSGIGRAHHPVDGTRIDLPHLGEQLTGEDLTQVGFP